MRLKVAEKAVEAYAQLAQRNNTMIVPGELVGVDRHSRGAAKGLAGQGRLAGRARVMVRAVLAALSGNGVFRPDWFRG